MEDGQTAELRLSVKGLFTGDDIIAFTRFLANFTMYPFLHDFSVDWWNIIVDVGPRSGLSRFQRTLCSP